MFNAGTLLYQNLGRSRDGYFRFGQVFRFSVGPNRIVKNYARKAWNGWSGRETKTPRSTLVGRCFGRTTVVRKNGGSQVQGHRSFPLLLSAADVPPPHLPSPLPSQPPPPPPTNRDIHIARIAPVPYQPEHWPTTSSYHKGHEPEEVWEGGFSSSIDLPSLENSITCACTQCLPRTVPNRCVDSILGHLINSISIAYVIFVEVSGYLLVTIFYIIFEFLLEKNLRLKATLFIRWPLRYYI